MHKNQDPDIPLADPRSAFVTEVIALARKHRNAVRAQAVTKSGHAVLLTGMWGKASARSTSPPDVAAVHATVESGPQWGRS